MTAGHGDMRDTWIQCMQLTYICMSVIDSGGTAKSLLYPKRISPGVHKNPTDLF